MAETPQIHGTLLARNTALNLIGQVIPLLVGLATIPYVVRGLGTERFGILSLAWLLLGYFSLFDLGLGRATTKFVAECLGRGEMDRLPGVVWTALGFQVLSGVAGGLLVGALTPLLVDRILKIPSSLVGETKTTFFILAASLPFVLASNSLRGVLEAGQRFDMVNFIKVPASISVFLLPAIALPFGLRLPGIVLLLVLARLGSTLAYLLVCFRIFPVLRHSIRFSFQSKILRPLAAYGGWLTVTNVVSPVLVYADRFLIGSLLSVSAIGYYAAPYEAVARLSVLYGSLVTALFPAFSSLRSAGDLDGLEHMYAKSIKFLLLIVGPVMLVLVFFARNLLLLWLGEDFALHSTFVFRLFAVGFFLTSLFVVPFTLLQGLGRADITAKFHVAELFFYVPLVWVLTMHWGLRGAAIAWTCRVIGDGVLLFGAAWRVFSFSPVLLIRKPCSRSILLLTGFGLLLYLVAKLEITIFLKGALTAGLAIAFYGGVWNYVLDPPEKGIIGSLARYLATAPRESN